MVQFIDTTLRDGVQAHWSSRMPVQRILPVLLSMDKAGYQALDCMAAVQFEISVKFLKENPWQRFAAIRQAVKDTPLITHIRSRSLLGFNVMPLDVIQLYIERLAANGFDRIMVFDALHDLSNLEPSVRHARGAGMHVVVVIFFTISPFHTDEYYAGVAERVVGLGADSICLRDPSGLLTPERTRTLIPTLRKALGGTPLELKSHCTTGLAPDCYLEAMKAGVDSLFTAAQPLANGPSVPAVEQIIEVAKKAKINIGIDEARLRDINGYMARVAAEDGKPIGTAVERPDQQQYKHQVPGGMISFLRDQLKEIGASDKLEAVLEEIPQVREAFGYPVMVTPISQLVGVQAVLNVIHGSYEMIPTEVRNYISGHFGTPEGPLSQNLVDRVAASKSPLRDRSHEAEDTVKRIRETAGPFEDDDDLILHIMFHEEQLSQIPPYNLRNRDNPAGPVTSLLDTLKALSKQKRSSSIHISTSQFSLDAE